MKRIANQNDAVSRVEKPQMTSMIDVVFLLLIFFIVTMKFKTLDMKIEANLPTEVGVQSIITTPPERVKVAVALDHRANGRTVIKVANQVLGSVTDAATWERLLSRIETTKSFVLAEHENLELLTVEVDADSDVEMGHVVRAVDTAAGLGIPDIRFVGTPPRAETALADPR